MSEREDEVLLHLAQSVADGQPVDWEAASMSGDASIQRLKRLQILASIATACGMPPAPITAAPTGDVLFRWGHLEIREKIGEGVFGEVYRAWETTLEREVAVKFLRAGATPDAAHVLLEGRYLAKVRHPGVATVYGTEELDGRVGLWMEYVRGRTLEDLLQERGPSAAPEAIQIGIDLCRALTAVHDARLVHRDVKTRNVVREEGGRIVLMDFGTGVHLEHGADHAFAGTPIYLAPEVLRGEHASPQSDVYGLGVLLYRLVTRSYPIRGTDLDALRDAHARGEARPLHLARPDLPAPFVRAVEKALAADPRQRFGTAAHMEKALAAARAAPAATRWARIVLVSAVAALGLYVAVQRWRSAPPAGSGRTTVVVTDFVNRTQEADLDGLASLLIMSLEQSRALSVLTRSRMNDYLARDGRTNVDRIDESRGREICRLAGAGSVLLLPSIRKQGETYAVEVEGLDPRRKRRLFRVALEANGRQEIPVRIDALSERVRAALEETPAAGAHRPVAQLATTNVAAHARFDRAERLIDGLEMQAAHTELEAAVALDSGFGLAHSRLAYVCWWLNDVECEREQLARARRLMDRIPEKSRYLLRAQSAMADREGLEAARSILLEMERFYPDDKEMLYDIGDYSSHLNEFPTAIQYLEKVIAMDPDFVRGLQHLTRVHRDMGRREAFLEWAKRYATADSSWDCFDLLGNAQVASGDVAAGIATLLQGGKLASVRPDEFTMSIALAHLEHGRDEEALAAWDRYLAAGPSRAQQAFAYQQRARNRVHRGHYQAALADLDRSIAVCRQDHNQVEEIMARVGAAFLWTLGRNDAVEAQAQLKHCAEIDRVITYRDTYFNYWVYWGGRFKLDLLNGNSTAAESLAKQKFAADKWYGPYVAAYLHAAKGDCALAAAAASRILEWGPAAENIELLYFLARCQFEHGDLGGAVESLLRLQSLYSNLTQGTPYYPKSLRLLGEVYEKQGDGPQATRTYERLLEFWSNADRDLPDHLEARRRVQALKQRSPR